MKGTLSYFKVRKEHIAKAAIMGSFINQHVVHIFHGPMTPEQRRKARKQAEIRPLKVLSAIDWLVENNKYWSSVDPREIRSALVARRPVVMDLSTNAVAPNGIVRNQDVESDSVFSVYFPDGTMTHLSGGQDSAEEFRNIIAKANSNGFDADITIAYDKMFTKDFVDDNFVSSCLLQMPYGLGGPKQARCDTNGNAVMRTTAAVYASHVCYKSLKHFHDALFVLKLFNMKLCSKIWPERA